MARPCHITFLFFSSPQLSLNWITAWCFGDSVTHRLAFHLCLSCVCVESRLEGWLSIPNKPNIKRYGWKKQVCHLDAFESFSWRYWFILNGTVLVVLMVLPRAYSFGPTWFFLTLILDSIFPQYVVVSSKKILFYNDEQDKEQSNPSMVLDIE